MKCKIMSGCILQDGHEGDHITTYEDVEYGHTMFFATKTGQRGGGLELPYESVLELLNNNIIVKPLDFNKTYEGDWP